MKNKIPILYFIRFQDVGIFKIGRSIRGWNRFQDNDYQTAFKYYGHPSMIRLYTMNFSNLNDIEFNLINDYKKNQFENIANKTEFFIENNRYKEAIEIFESYSKFQERS